MLALGGQVPFVACSLLNSNFQGELMELLLCREGREADVDEDNDGSEGERLFP